jgi:hypothetical protein
MLKLALDESRVPVIRKLDENESVLKQVDDREIEVLTKQVLTKLERLEQLALMPHQRGDITPIEVGYIASAIHLIRSVGK